MPKLETLVIITKGVCLTYIPMGTAISVGLPEIGAPSILGMPIKFWTMLFGATVAGAGGLLAFLTSSFQTYSQQMKADNTGEVQRTEIKPTVKVEQSKEKE